MKKTLKIVGYFFLVAFIVIQFIRPDKNQGSLESIAAFQEDTSTPENVMVILKTQCFDCHTNVTKYPWYAEIAPFSFWLDDHIFDAKKHFNMSEWSSFSAKKKDHKLEELIEEVEEGEMPLPSYTWIHGTLSDADKKTLLDWANIARLNYERELQVSSK
jgi:hypothetical protein